MNHRPEIHGRRHIAANCTAGPLVGLLLPLLMLSLAIGCRRPSSAPGGVDSGRRDLQRAQRRELLDYAVKSIFEYEKQRGPERTVWEEAVNRLDRWIRDQEALPEWQVDPMAASLAEPFSELLGPLKLDQLAFPNPDAFALLEAVWLRDISSWARGDAVEELDQAAQLFDWTVRNIQLASPGAAGSGGWSGVLQNPGETLLFGRGTATERAWVFILLARQQNIDAALLALSDPQDPTGQKVRPWAVGVLSRGQLYLFEPALGVPIPAPDGIGRGPEGQLEFRPATLAQVAGDDALLRQLDAGPDLRYPLEASQVQNVVALLEASPAYLARRMEILESQLAGDDKVVLTTDASAQAERFKACRQVIDARLWELPYQTITQELHLGTKRRQWIQLQMVPFAQGFDTSPTVPQHSEESGDGWGWWTVAARQQRSSDSRAAAPGRREENSASSRELSAALWRGRMLHFKGVLDGEESAAFYYTRARLPNSVLDSEQLDPRVKMSLVVAKMHASYWLGLVAAHGGNVRAAIDYLATRVLEASPGGPWTHGAKYNLGREYEADGQIAEAIRTYRSDLDSPCRHGNLLRARWLESGATPESTKPSEPAAERPEASQDLAPPRKRSADAEDESDERPQDDQAAGKTAPGDQAPAASVPPENQPGEGDVAPSQDPTNDDLEEGSESP